MSLIFGYNGVNRLLGMGGGGGPSNGFANGGAPAQGPSPNRAFPPPTSTGTNNGLPPMQPQFNGNGIPPNSPGNNGGPTGGGPGGFNIGQPGALRLFVVPLSKEVSWLLPFGIFAALAVLLARVCAGRLNQNIRLWFCGAAGC